MLDIIVFDGEEEIVTSLGQIEQEPSVQRIVRLFQATSVYVDSARELLKQPHSMRFAVKAWQAEMGLKALARKMEAELGLDRALYIAADTNVVIQLEKSCDS